MSRRLIGLALVALLVTGCGADERSGDIARFDGQGGHAVGVATLDLGEDLGPVDVWYPAVGTPRPSGAAIAGAPAHRRAGTAPLLVFAHGSGLEPSHYAPLLRHAASWGVVVASPRLGRGLDLVAVAEAVRAGARDLDPAAPTLAGGPIVVGGHSRGTAEASTAALDEEVSGAILLAGGGVTAAVAEAHSPLLFVAGGNDAAHDGWIRGNADGATGPHQLVVVADAGHLSFTDLCADGATVRAPGDCTPADVAESSVQPVLRHLLVAFARWRGGLDGSADALAAEVLSSFDTAVAVEGDLDAGT